jgi:hypothetical protein
MKSPTRISIRQAAHKELLRHDAEYRRRFHYYLITLLSLSCLMLPFYLPFFGIRLFGYPANQCIILSLAALIVLLTLRQFHFQKQSIQRHSEMNQRKINGGSLWK